jgi:hypothetical protein
MNYSKPLMKSLDNVAFICYLILNLQPDRLLDAFQSSIRDQEVFLDAIRSSIRDQVVFFEAIRSSIRNQVAAQVLLFGTLSATKKLKKYVKTLFSPLSATK